MTTSVLLTSAGLGRHLSREEGAPHNKQKSGHRSVMLGEVVTLLAPKRGDIVVDATYGMGGHSKALSKAASIKLIALDADPASEVIEANFGDLAHVLKQEKVTTIDKALFDLGWNSTQLVGKGFSFLHDEPLNMSYGPKPRSGFTAKEIVNGWSEKVLADVLFGYGEERYARPIAKAIVARREIQPIETTIELAEIIKDAVPGSYRHGRIHPATRSFQALRIAVNDELKVAEDGIAAAWSALACNGRIAVITFHSIEDRLVKQLFAARVKAHEGKLIVKKPMVPTREEITSNPRSRSAKLRVIEKICLPKK